MKKIICVLSLLFLAACSSDDSSEQQTGVLIKKIIETFEGSGSQTTTYAYNGNKVLYALTNNDDRKIVYTYSGNVITNISFQNLTGYEFSHTTFSYDSSQRLKHVEVLNTGLDNENYADYTYNADGTVTVVSHYWDDFEMEYSVQNQKYFLSDGDIVKIETYLSGGTQTAIYNYDTKNHPYKNITGFDKLMDFYLGSHNNISSVLTGTDGGIIQQSTTTYTYNGEDYPLTSFQTGIGSDKTTEYYYE